MNSIDPKIEMLGLAYPPRDTILCVRRDDLCREIVSNSNFRAGLVSVVISEIHGVYEFRQISWATLMKCQLHTPNALRVWMYETFGFNSGWSPHANFHVFFK